MHAVSEVKPPSTSTRKHNLGPKSLYTFPPSFQLDETKDFHFKNEKEMGLDLTEVEQTLAWKGKEYKISDGSGII